MYLTIETLHVTSINTSHSIVGGKTMGFSAVAHVITLFSATQTVFRHPTIVPCKTSIGDETFVHWKCYDFPMPKLRFLHMQINQVTSCIQGRECEIVFSAETVVIHDQVYDTRSTPELQNLSKRFSSVGIAQGFHKRNGITRIVSYG